MSFDFAEIIEGVKTKSDAGELLRELELLENGLYNSDDNAILKLLDEGVSKKLSSVIKNNITKGNQSYTTDVIKTILREIKEGVNKLEIFRIDIGVEPTEKMINTIYKWISENVENKCVLDISVDKTIIAGARISFRGKYTDMTMDKKWDEIWVEIMKDFKVINKQEE